MFVRFSKTREEGANHTVATKLTEEDKLALHWLAMERCISDYEMVRRVLLDFIRGAGRL